MIAARPGPTSATSAPNRTNAAAVQKRPSTTSDASASADGVRDGGAAAASGVSTTAATSSAAPIVARGPRSLRRRLSHIGPAA